MSQELRDLQALRDHNYNATVTHIDKVHDDLMLMRVRRDGGALEHRPGQYTTLGLGYWEPRVEGCQDESLTEQMLSRVVTRTYSIACPMTGENGELWRPGEELEFFIVLVRQADDARPPALTSRLFKLEVGDRLKIGDRAMGVYTADPIGDDDAVIFLATGTGEAPHNYMIWELLGRGHKGKIVSACSARFRRDLYYAPAHEKLKAGCDNYQHFALSTRDVDKKRYIQDLLRDGDLESAIGQPVQPGNVHIYLCGNPAMIGMPKTNRDTGERTFPIEGGMVELLEQRGFELKRDLHTEEYW